MDNSPVGYTCPIIDDLIGKLQNTITQAKYYIDKPINDELTDDMDTVIWYINDVIDGFEGIRSANSKLREWGNELYNETESLKEKISELEHELSNCG